MLVDGLLVIYINMCSISHVSCELWNLDKLDRFNGYGGFKPEKYQPLGMKTRKIFETTNHECWRFCLYKLHHIPYVEMTIITNKHPLLSIDNVNPGWN